jgi:type II secretory pathway pseudopilin PulG
LIMASTPSGSSPQTDPDLRQLLDRLDSQEQRVRRRAVYLTALPILATLVCLGLIGIVLSRSLTQLADARAQQKEAEAAMQQAEQAQQVAEGRTALAVQELENIRKQIEDAQKALAELRPTPGASARVIGNVAAAAARSVREIDGVTSALSVRAGRAGEAGGTGGAGWAGGTGGSGPDAVGGAAGGGAKGGGVASAPAPSSSLSGGRTELIKALYSTQPATRIRAYNALMSAHAQDDRLIPELLEVGKAELARTPLNANGIFNTLVVLSHVNRARLAPHRDDVRRFAEEARSVGGPTTRDRAETLLSRVP